MIYTFYSYKGGVGRSMALANIAELFYRKGLRVLLVDFDLEAPGLEQYFFTKGDPKLIEIQSHRGLIDLLLSYKELRALPPLKVPPKSQSEEDDSIVPGDANSSTPKQFPYPVEPLTNFVTAIYERTDFTRGELSIVTAGRRLREATVAVAGGSSSPQRSPL